MPVRGGDFAREDHLHACKQRVRGAGFARHPGIFQNEHPPLGFLGGDQSAGFHHQTLDVVEMPDYRGAAGYGLLGDHVLHHLPERGHVVLGNALVIFLPDGFDIVLGDEVAGHVDLMFNEATGALPYVLSGQIKTYAVLAKTQWFAAPQIPTSEKMGVPGSNISFWHGLWVPKGTPTEIVLKLNAAIVDALADATVRKRLTDIGQEIFPRDRQTPEALYVFHKAETEKWWPIIKGAGIKNE